MLRQVIKPAMFDLGHGRRAEQAQKVEPGAPHLAAVKSAPRFGAADGCGRQADATHRREHQHWHAARRIDLHWMRYIMSMQPLCAVLEFLTRNVWKAFHRIGMLSGHLQICFPGKGCRPQALRLPTCIHIQPCWILYSWSCLREHDDIGGCANGLHERAAALPPVQEIDKQHCISQQCCQVALQDEGWYLYLLLGLHTSLEVTI